MNAVTSNPRMVLARVGAALAAFVLAFSLLTMVSPAHADGAKTWIELKQWETQRGIRQIRLIAWFLCYP